MQLSPDRLSVLFHREYSRGTAAVRGTLALTTTTIRYWEIHASHRVFGTALMFGVGQRHARLHVDHHFCQLVGGVDASAWGLCHKGSIWHDGLAARNYCAPFDEHTPTVVGMLFDGPAGTLAYYRDGIPLGVAFYGLRDYCPLYPMVSSTAARSELRIGMRRRAVHVECLAQRTMNGIIGGLRSRADVDRLPLPDHLQSALRQRWTTCRRD